MSKQTDTSLVPYTGRHPALPAEEALARKLRPRTLGRRVIQLLRWADLWAPSLVAGNSRAFADLARLDWIRPLEDLRPEAAPHTLETVVDHLLCKYSVPNWVCGAFAAEAGRWPCPNATWTSLVTVAAVVARGGGYDAVRWLLPGQLNRRIYANLLASDAASPLVALRQAQCVALGGPPWLAAALAGHWTCGAFAWPDLPTLSWLAREAEELEFTEVLAFLYRRPVDLTGRTWASVRRLVHAPVPLRLDARPFVLSGFSSDLPPEFPTWRMRELRSPLELAVDGKVMHHCVGTYSAKVRARKSSIWSLRTGEERCLTIEVSNGTREIIQVRGPGNRGASRLETSVLSAWAAANALRLLGSAMKR